MLIHRQVFTTIDSVCGVGYNYMNAYRPVLTKKGSSRNTYTVRCGGLGSRADVHGNRVIFAGDLREINSKNKLIRERVDSRVQYVWRLLVMGSWIGVQYLARVEASPGLSEGHPRLTGHFYFIFHQIFHCLFLSFLDSKLTTQ